MDKVHILIIDNEYGTSVSAYATREALDAYLYSYVCDEWENTGIEQLPDTFKAPADAISTYFENEGLGNEWHVIECVQIEQ